jgi:hypothetical protein
MRRAAIVILAVFALFVAASCKRGRGEHSCAVDPNAGCICKNETFTISPTSKAASECGAAPADVPSRCCHDLDSQNETKTCFCSRAVCRKSDRGWCGCEFVESIGNDYTAVPLCEPVNTQKCCQEKELGKCTCDAWDHCPSTMTQVDRCLPTALKPGSCGSNASHESKSCDGVNWKKKT